jgi:hypothetical protein
MLAGVFTPRDELASLRVLATAQDDVVSRAQLLELGVDRHVVRDQVRARRWRLVGRAIVLHRGPLTDRQRWWVAVIHVGQGAALASLTSAQAAGLAGWPAEQVHVVVTRGGRVHALPWIKVHESRRFAEADVHPSRTPRQCRPERAVIDAASWKPHPRQAAAVLCAAVQQGVTTVTALRDVLGEAGSIRHRAIMRRVLEDIEGGSHALTEIDLVRICRQAGLPRPTQQVPRRDASGRQRYLDAQLVRPDGRVLILEVDGALHLDPLRWWDDQARSNDLVVQDGALLLRFPAVALRIDRQTVVKQLRRAYFGSPVVRQYARISARTA